MLRRVVTSLKEKKNRHLAYTVAGMGALMAGGKVSGLTLFGLGLAGLEQDWREHRGFTGTWAERLEKSAAFYDGTHQDPTNRKLHRVGIPLIVGGAAGLILFPRYRPMWAASWGMFTGGWVLNFIGHGIYEKNAPAFADDPLSFMMGPLWDLKQLRGQPTGPAPAPAQAPAPEPVAVGA